MVPSVWDVSSTNVAIMMYEVVHQGWGVSSGSAMYAYANGLVYPGNLLTLHCMGKAVNESFP